MRLKQRALYKFERTLPMAVIRSVLSLCVRKCHLQLRTIMPQIIPNHWWSQTYIQQKKRILDYNQNCLHVHSVCTICGRVVLTFNNELLYDQITVLFLVFLPCIIRLKWKQYWGDCKCFCTVCLWDVDGNTQGSTSPPALSVCSCFHRQWRKLERLFYCMLGHTHTCTHTHTHTRTHTNTNTQLCVFLLFNHRKPNNPNQNVMPFLQHSSKDVNVVL